MSFKRRRVSKSVKCSVSSSTHRWERSTRIYTSLCEDFLSHSKVTMLVLQQQLSLFFTWNKYEVARIVLTVMSWANYMEHML